MKKIITLVLFSMVTGIVSAANPENSDYWRTPRVFLTTVSALGLSCYVVDKCGPKAVNIALALSGAAAIPSLYNALKTDFSDLMNPEKRSQDLIGLGAAACLIHAGCSAGMFPELPKTSDQAFAVVCASVLTLTGLDQLRDRFPASK